MTDQKPVPNYPDILGYITDDQHLTIGVVQAALAVRPPVARVSRPFAVVLLLQNMSDASVDITATLHLPLKDAAGQKSHFATPKTEMEIKLLPAEVGYLVMPVNTLPRTAIAQDYTIAVDVQVKGPSKPRFIRQVNTTDEINLDYYFSLTEEAIQKLIVLKMLNFSVKKRGVFGNMLEANFALAPAKEMPRNDVKAGWFSLWSVGADGDARPLLERFRGTLALSVVPKLKPIELYKALYPVTKERFIKAYPLKSIEIHFITKLMVYILSLAPHPPLIYHYPEEAMYTIMTILKSGWPTDGTPIPLPYWCRGLLHMIGMDAEVLENPILAFSGALYDDLLRDALVHGFHIMSVATQRQLGTNYDIRIFTDYLAQQLRRVNHPLTFTDVYLPLVLAGMVVADDVPLPNEPPLLERIHTLMKLYNARAQTERNAETELAFLMAEDVSNFALRRYSDWM